MKEGREKGQGDGGLTGVHSKVKEVDRMAA
jgi:hypothetical protein